MFYEFLALRSNISKLFNSIRFELIKGFSYKSTSFFDFGRTGKMISNLPHKADNFCKTNSFAIQLHERSIYFIFLTDNCLNECLFLCIPLVLTRFRSQKHDSFDSYLNILFLLFVGLFLPRALRGSRQIFSRKFFGTRFCFKLFMMVT